MKKLLMMMLLLIGAELTAHEKTTCYTESNGLDFEYASLAIKVARENAVAKCTNNRHTSINECVANLYCDGETRGPF